MLLENLRFYAYFVIGKPSVLYLLCNWNYVVGTSL